jgi:hypothetical protein
MALTEWAGEQAERLLSPLGRRLVHSRAVARWAEVAGAMLAPRDADVLVAAAYLHEVGYARSLARAGFHPLDSARWLAELGHVQLAGLVAQHSRPV